jgi:hypothetical protein
VLFGADEIADYSGLMIGEFHLSLHPDLRSPTEKMLTKQSNPLVVALKSCEADRTSLNCVGVGVVSSSI